jgi:beta-glucosidase
LSNSEKANITLGSDDNRGCGGFVGPLSSIGFDGLCLQDAESGVRGAALVNGYAAQLSIGASWNRALAYDRGFYIGKEHQDKGVSVALGPVSNTNPFLDQFWS